MGVYVINPDGSIQLSLGDTLSFNVNVTVTGYTPTEDDIALFTIKSSGGAKVYEKVYPLVDPTTGETKFLVTFQNADTDALSPGSYTYDVRFVINPTYDEETGRVTGGDQVITPKLPLPFTLLTVVGEV